MAHIASVIFGHGFEIAEQEERGRGKKNNMPSSDGVYILPETRSGGVDKERHSRENFTEGTDAALAPTIVHSFFWNVASVAKYKSN